VPTALQSAAVSTWQPPAVRQQATGGVQSSHTLPSPETYPPRVVHAVAVRRTRGVLVVVQSAAVVHATVVSLLHFNERSACVSHVPVPVMVQQSTAPGLPHVERAEQLAIVRCDAAVRHWCFRRSLRKWTTHFWCWP